MDFISITNQNPLVYTFLYLSVVLFDRRLFRQQIWNGVNYVCQFFYLFYPDYIPAVIFNLLLTTDSGLSTFHSLPNIFISERAEMFSRVKTFSHVLQLSSDKWHGCDMSLNFKCLWYLRFKPSTKTCLWSKVSRPRDLGYTQLCKTGFWTQKEKTTPGLEIWFIYLVGSHNEIRELTPQWDKYYSK